MTNVLGIFGFLSFGWVDLLDIFMMGLLIFFIVRSIRGDSTVFNIVIVLVVLLLLQALVSALGMRMMTALLSALLDVGVLAVLILFQPEIRHMLNRVAVQSGIARRSGQLFNRLLGIKEETMGSHSAEELGEAVRAMSAEKTGALIVLQHKSSMDEYMETGDRFEADINRRLIMNIFFKNSPLHDGAMIIGNNRIKAAGCILPVSHSHDIPRELGLRHRSAMGISQQSDAIAIVVSEETGRISAAINGNFRLRLSAEELEKIINS